MTNGALRKLVVLTGAAGFIGFHLAERLLKEGYRVVGIDNMSDYYDVALKEARLERLRVNRAFEFIRVDIADADAVAEIFRRLEPKVVINLAAQAGVRYSLENPDVYIQSNIVGFANVLEACRNNEVDHLVYASSSSVYGGNVKVPFDEADPVEHPVSLYAATKRSNELMADCYSHLYHVPSTGLRFFTVYGPFGRPDMAYYSFAESYFANKPILVFNNGDIEEDLSRDFTYVDDVVESIVRLLPLPPISGTPHQIYNIGGSMPESLTNFISMLEFALTESLGKPVEFTKVFEPRKPGDVQATYANTSRLESLTGYKPRTDLRLGLKRFADWFIRYKGLGGVE